jgi:IS5 family transposase
VPDHSTIWRFRQQLAEEGRIEALFREINEQLSQHGLFIKNGSFILFCGATHFMSIWTLWYPDYWLEGIIKVAMAVISVATAIILIPLIPKVFELPSPKQLRETLCVITAERCHTNSHAERGN